MEGQCRGVVGFYAERYALIMQFHNLLTYNSLGGTECLCTKDEHNGHFNCTVSSPVGFSNDSRIFYFLSIASTLENARAIELLEECLQALHATV